MAEWSKATAPSCYGHTSALAFQPPLYMCVCCKSNPLPASGAHPPEVRSAAANTQADATLPRIGVRGGANRRITPGPHSQPSAHGHLWGPLGAYGGLWEPMGAYGHLWGPMGNFGDLWGPMGAYGHLFFFATFPAHTFSPFSHFGVESLFYFCTAMFLIVQGGSPIIFQLCPPFLFFSFFRGVDLDLGIVSPDFLSALDP